MKDVEFKMRTRITAEIFPNEVIAFREKFPGREDGETAKFPDSIFLRFGDKVSMEKQGRQQPNAKVQKGQDIKFLAQRLCNILPARQIAPSLIQRHGKL